MYKKSFLQPILLGLIAILFASCDKDYNELGTDIIGDDNFDFERYTDATIKSYNQKLGPVASNNLAINALGYYANPVFGTTHANFVTQVEMADDDPTFNNTDPENYDIHPTAIDSVLLEVPYFAHVPRNATITDNVKPYVLDSIYGATPENSKFKLSVYQSNYFLRDLDPSQALGQAQPFYTDENNTIDNNKSVLLNDAPRVNEPNGEGTQNADGHENEEFYFDKREHKTFVKNESGTKVYTRSAPSMRLHLNKAFFTNLILNAPDGKLETNTAFKNYFRGIYFKTEGGAPGHMAMLNFKGGKITVYYNEDKKSIKNNVTSFERVNKTFVLNMTGNSISLLENSNENPNYVNAVTNTSEASQLYLKGGEGSVGMIDLFGDPTATNYDTYRYVIKKLNGKPVDENGQEIKLDSNGNPVTGKYYTYEKVNTPNGIADELDDLRYPKYTTSNGVDYYSIKNRWMINEANLTFHIVSTGNSDMLNPAAIEPLRIFIYDLTNHKAIVDYAFDLTSNAIYPKYNKLVFGGLLFDANGVLVKQKENATGNYVNKGAKYKVRLTNHIRNLIRNDSTNVRIGVSVTESIANVAFSKLRNPNSNIKHAPTMSVMSPTGTILYGTNPAVPNDKRLKLEIYYTKPD